MVDADAPGRANRRSLSSAQRLAREFYFDDVVEQAAKISPDEAFLIEGLDGEIALLRTKVRELRDATGADITLLLKGIDLLVKAVAARHRLSPTSKRDLADSIGRLIQGASDIMAQEHVDV